MLGFLLPILKRPLPGHTHAHPPMGGWMDTDHHPLLPGSKSRRETSVSCDLNILALNKSA